MVKIFIAIPTHDYTVHFHFMKSYTKLIQKLNTLNINYITTHISGSLINRSRNQLASIFMVTDCTHILFIDSDISNFENIITNLLNANKMVIGGIYPIKEYNWNKILALDKKNKSVDEILTKTLSYNINIGSQRIINDIVYFRRNEQNISHNDIIEEANMNNGIIEVMHLPGGCMLIKKEAIKIMMDKYPERKYNSCNNEKTYKNSSDFLYNLFDSFIKKYTTNKQYLSEDYGFCELWIKLDRKIYANINIPLSHSHGDTTYSGSYINSLLP